MFVTRHLWCDQVLIVTDESFDGMTLIMKRKSAKCDEIRRNAMREIKKREKIKHMNTLAAIDAVLLRKIR